MTPNEFRIGNLVMRKSSGEYQQILSVTREGVGLKNVPPLNPHKGMILPYASILPIPLSPEWMEKCGFMYKEKEIGPPINDVLDAWKHPNTLIAFFFDMSNRLVLEGYNWNHKRLDYVHQLQNLYFSLSGEELNIQL